jgi:hypothetical protein
MEFAYDGGGLAKGGTVTLYLDGDKVGEGRVEATVPMIFSADETADVGSQRVHGRRVVSRRGSGAFELARGASAPRIAWSSFRCRSSTPARFTATSDCRPGRRISSPTEPRTSPSPMLSRRSARSPSVDSWP